MKCLTFGCHREPMEGERHCALCTVQLEKEAGRAGFEAHGREPSELFKRADAELGDREMAAVEVEVLPDFKPPKRVHDSEASRRKLINDRECRICRKKATDGHHVVLRSQGGDDVEDNLVPLCRACHTSYHNAIGEIALSEAETRYLVEKAGPAAQYYAKKRRLVLR